MSICIPATASAALINFNQFIYDYQTLITGLLAVGAAWLASRPVWRQLTDSNLQARIIHRETLMSMLHDAQQRFARVSKEMTTPLFNLSDVTSDPEGNDVEIDEPTAFNFDQVFGGIIDWYLVGLRDTESEKLERAKAALTTSLDSLVETLSDIHWPAHNDQSGEDYSMTDEQWETVLQKAQQGKLDASERCRAARKAFDRLQKAQEEWLAILRAKITILDRAIAANT